jgi:hypothetical protein
MEAIAPRWRTGCQHLDGSDRPALTTAGASKQQRGATSALLGYASRSQGEVVRASRLSSNGLVPNSRLHIVQRLSDQTHVRVLQLESAADSRGAGFRTCIGTLAGLRFARSISSRSAESDFVAGE